MLHLPPARRLRTLVYILVFLTLSAVTLRSRIPTAPIINVETEHLSEPIYEHASPYRQRANHTYEEVLEKNLLLIEQTARSSLPQQTQPLTADRAIWQITSPAEAAHWADWTQQWRASNPDWEIKQFNPSNPGDLRTTYQTIPQIAHTLSLHPDIATHLYRWLLLYYNGGFFLEPDIWPRFSIADCPPMREILNRSPRSPHIAANVSRAEYKPDTGPRRISLVLGVDIDEPYMTETVQKKWGWSRTFAFATYAMWAPERFDPLLRKAIVRCVAHAEGIKKGDEVGDKEVGEICGGGMLTDVVFDGLSEALVDAHPVRDMDAGLERRVTWKKFRHLKKPVWVDGRDVREGEEVNMRGLGVLPVNVWGSGQRHSRAGRFDHVDACINHVYGHKPSTSIWQKIFG
jgi:alpha 1,6-mannosyltransferase